MDKAQFVEQVVKKLGDELSALMQAAEAAHAAATHEESRAEDAHDTRGLEASYLAGAQAARAAELRDLITMFKFLPLRVFKPSDPIGPGAWLLLESGGRRSQYFFAAKGGGISISMVSGNVQVITPQAPLGEALVGRCMGDEVDVETQDSVREYKILRVG